LCQEKSGNPDVVVGYQEHFLKLYALSIVRDLGSLIIFAIALFFAFQ
jgi:hypothetical protein